MEVDKLNEIKSIKKYIQAQKCCFTLVEARWRLFIKFSHNPQPIIPKAWSLIAMSVRSSDSQTPSVSSDILGSLAGDLCVCVLCSWLVNPARRHNDTAIDSTMSSRERLTNQRARVCFSQPPIGWGKEAVGLQVAEWTSERSCSLPPLFPLTHQTLPPSACPASWRMKEGVRDVAVDLWPVETIQ